MIITKYEDLKVGHYFSFFTEDDIDGNYRFVGKVSEIITNEVDSSKPKYIHGFIELNTGLKRRINDALMKPADFGCETLEEMKEQFPEEFV